VIKGIFAFGDILILSIFKVKNRGKREEKLYI